MEVAAFVGGKKIYIKLLNVLYVSGATCNLFSVKQATKNDVAISFTAGKCAITTGGTPVVAASCIDRLNYIQASYVERESAKLSTSNDTAQLWHRRFLDAWALTTCRSRSNTTWWKALT